MAVLDRFLAILAPHDCLGCSAEGALLCPACLDLLPDVPPRCYRCRKNMIGSLTCQGCRKTSRLHQVVVSTDYEGIAQELIWKLKFTGAQSAAQQIATSLRQLFKHLSGEALIVPVPTATSRVRQRGYDQAKLIARELALQTGLPYFDCLARHGQSHQVGANRLQRLHQLEQAFRVTKAVQGKQLILVDDVITTGATLEAAAQTLRRAGAAQIDALVFAQP